MLISIAVYFIHQCDFGSDHFDVNGKVSCFVLFIYMICAKIQREPILHSLKGYFLKAKLTCSVCHFEKIISVNIQLFKAQNKPGKEIDSISSHGKEKVVKKKSY